MKRTWMTLFMMVFLVAGSVFAEEAKSEPATKTTQSLLEMLEKNNPEANDDKKVEEIKEETAPIAVEQAVATPLVDQARDASFPWLKNILSTAVVLSSILALAFIYNKKQGNSPSLLKSKVKSLKVIQSVSLGLKKNLYVVEFENERLLIGATATTLSILHHHQESTKVELKQEVEQQTAIQQQPVVMKQISNNPASVLTTPVQPAEEASIAALDKIPEPLASRIRDKVFNLKPIKGAPAFKEDLFEKSLRKFSKDDASLQGESLSQAIRGNNLNTLM